MVRVQMSAAGSLPDLAARLRAGMAQDVTIALRSVTAGAVQDMRQDLSRAFPQSRRIATLVTGKAEPSARNVHSLNAEGRVYGRGGKRSTWPAPLWAQAFGADIAPRRARVLAIPTNRVPRDGRNRALTPEEVEQRFGEKLVRIPPGRLGKAGALVLLDRPITRAGRVGARRANARRKNRPVVMFWLVKQARLNPRWDPRGIMQRWAALVPQFIDQAKRVRETGGGGR